MSPGSPPTRVRWWEDEGGATTEQAPPTPPPPAPPPPAPAPRPAGGGRRQLLWVAVTLVAAVVAVAAVFTVREATTPVAEPRPAPVARDAAEPPERRAPGIEAPRDLSGFVRAPCSLLENRQARDLGYTRWSTREPSDGPRECRFTVNGPLRTLTLSALDGPDGSAFADLYREPRPPVFVPLEIEGLPAVRTQAFATSELCRVTVGVAEGQSLRADTAVPDDRDNIPITDPCVRAERGAQEAVANLPRER